MKEKKKEHVPKKLGESSGKRKNDSSKSSGKKKFKDVEEPEERETGIKKWLKSQAKRKCTETKKTAKTKKKKPTGKEYREKRNRENMECELANIIENPSSVNFDEFDLDIDHLATGLLPSDIDSLPDDAQPLKSSPDGNCLFHSVSILLCGDQRLSSVLRERASEFMIQNPDVIAHHAILKDSASELRRTEDKLFPDMLAMVIQKSIWYKTNNRKQSIIKEGQRITKSGTFGSLAVMIALAEVTKRVIYSLYPNVEYKLRGMFHRKIVPSNAIEDGETLHILWSKHGDLDNSKGVKFTPNHFVPVVSHLGQH